jgi:hypothetical protein
MKQISFLDIKNSKLGKSKNDQLKKLIIEKRITNNQIENEIKKNHQTYLEIEKKLQKRSQNLKLYFE